VTDRELAEQLGYKDPNKVRPRRNELVSECKVSYKGQRVCKVTGQMAIIWGA